MLLMMLRMVNLVIVHGLGWFLCDFYVPYVSLHIIEVDHVGHQKCEGGHLGAWSDLRK